MRAWLQQGCDDDGTMGKPSMRCGTLAALPLALAFTTGAAAAPPPQATAPAAVTTAAMVPLAMLQRQANAGDAAAQVELGKRLMQGGRPRQAALRRD